MTINQYTDQILNEIKLVLTKTAEHQIIEAINEIEKANKIVVCGAGRVGMAIRGFGMRLGHMGKKAWTLGDSTVPSIGEKDLLIVASGSGETQTILDLVQIAKRNRSRILLFSGNKDSSMGELANTIVEVKAPSKTKSVEGINSIQPMTTLNEQCLGILFDSICLKMMALNSETHDTMWERHSNLE